MATKTPISREFNEKLQAKTADFNGWLMPTFYLSIIKEHQAVREHIGLFDVSHMGRQWITGADAKAFLSSIVCNKVDIADGKAVYTAMLNPEAGIIDDLIIYKCNDEKFLVVNNAGNHQKVCDWYKKQSSNYSDLEIKDVTETMGQIAVQGPKAKEAINEILGLATSLKYFNHISHQYQDQEIIITATGYTGEQGYELYAEPKLLMEIWQILIDNYQAQACGLGARDILRLEAGYCLHGNDIDEESSPYEAGLDWIVKNPEEYIGKSKAQRLNKKLMGLAFKPGEKILARAGTAVWLNDEEIGTITSGNFSPQLERGIALAYINDTNLKTGDTVIVKIRDREHIASLAEPWFYRNIRGKEIQEIR